MSESDFYIDSVLNLSSYFRKVLALFASCCPVLDVWGKVPKDVSRQLESYRERSGFIGFIRKKLFKEIRYRLNPTNVDRFQRVIGTPEVISQLNWGIGVESESLALCDVSSGHVFLCSSSHVENRQINTFLDELVNLELIDSYEAVNDD